MEEAPIRAISEWFVKPKHEIDEPKEPFYFGLFELAQMSHCYLQSGLMFDKLPSKDDGGMDLFLERLKQSLSSTLAHFYPLAGQFVTKVDEAKHKCFIYLDNNKGRGAKFIHAALDNVSVSDIVSPKYVPTVVQSLFELGHISTNYDAHDELVLVIQVTELVDGIFLGVSVNHAIADGTAYWHFLSSWSEIFRSNHTTISRKPTYERWFPQGYGPIIEIPYTHPNEFITRYKMDTENPIREVVIHFSCDSIATIKAKANADCGSTYSISTVQALSALLWRAMAHSRCLQSNEYSACYVVANCRSRLHPPLSQDNMGSFIYFFAKSVKVGELLENSLGWVGSLLRQAVEEFTGEFVHDEFVKWIKSPIFYKPGMMEPNSILIGGLPRADVNNIDFGLGKAVAIRSGSNKYDGKVVLRPGTKEKGSVSVEICLSHATMASFLQDKELMSFLY